MEMDKIAHYSIRDLRGDSQVPKRFCDSVRMDKILYVEIKIGKTVIRIPLKDFLYQVKLAKESLLKA